MSTVSSSGSRTGNVASIVNRMSQNFSKPDAMTRKNPVDKKKTFTARFSYQAEHKDELSFEVGSVIEGIEDAEEGWMKGKLVNSGEVGMFPLNFVDPSDDAEAKRERAEEKPLDMGRASVHPTAELSINTSSARSADASTTSMRPSTKRMSSNNSSELYANVPIIAEKEKPRERAKVLYKYEAEQPDEISIDVGALVTVMRRKIVDDGWLEVEYKGKTGLFPENFVKVLPPEENVKSTPSNQPPTPPPVKPKPSTPSSSAPPPLADVKFAALSQSLISTSNSLDDSKPAVTSNSTTSSAAPASSKIKELQKQIFPVGRNPPVPGFKPQLRPLTVIGNSSYPEDKADELTEENRITNHLIKDKPKQKQKRPPSMMPAATVNGDLTPSPVSSGPTPQTTSFPVKDTPPVTTSNKPALLPKTEPERVEKVESKTPPASVKLISQEAVIVPSKKPAIVHSSGSVSSIHTNVSNLTHHEESEFVTRKEYNLLLSKIAQLEKQVKDLSSRHH